MSSTVSDEAQAVTIKAPDFSEASPAIWFKVMEAQFHIKSIKQSQTKFFHVLSSLPSTVLETLTPDIMDGEKYEDLKASVISFYEKTKPELFEKLISSTVMTGRPSVYLRQLQQVAAKVGASEDLVRHKFLQSLPSTIAPAVGAQKTLTLAQLGSVADELIPLHSQINIVHKSSSYDSPPTSSYTHSPRDSHKPLYTNQSYSTGQKRNNSEFIPIGLRPYHPNQRPKFCRSHLYYAENARSCKPWCKYPNKNGCSMQPSSRPSSRSSSPIRPSEN